ncbi:MAG: penicillin-binding transpeptidase domain-containing protein [Candidatus Omnitrophota bacterium]
MYKRPQKLRLAIVFFSYLFILLVIFFRLLYIQVINYSDYIKLADSQHNLTLKLFPQRGFIFDRNLKTFALSLKVFSVYAVPREIENKEEVALKLSSILELDYNVLLEKLKRDKSFIWVKRRIEDDLALRVKQEKIKGVSLLTENKRYYPNAGLAAHVVGFAGIDENGLSGVELIYDKYLRGQAGKRSLVRDAKQRIMPAFEYEYIPEINGHNIVLTLDAVIQHIAEQELDAGFEKSKAVGASVIIMNPENGEIYALVNRPGYDLNCFGQAMDDAKRNRAVSDYFEPGSTFKIITASAVLEENVVALDDVFFCENGEYTVSRHILHDHTPHGNLSFVEVIEKSSNIGTVKIAQKLGPALLYKYIKKFGFGQKTDIDLPGEVEGFFRPLEQWSKLSIAALPIGHEIGVTVIQMARAMAVIANGGYLVNPHLVSKIIDSKNEIIKDIQPEPAARIISAKTAIKMRDILQGVVENGTGKSAKVKGYSTAGKTGTAQKVVAGEGYSHNKFIASFIGFAPAENPKVVIAVVFDEPKPFYYGGTVCAPIFKNIAEKVLKYMDVPMQNNIADQKPSTNQKNTTSITD